MALENNTRGRPKQSKPNKLSNMAEIIGLLNTSTVVSEAEKHLSGLFRIYGLAAYKHRRREEQEEASSRRRKTHRRSSETKHTRSGLGGSRHLQPKRYFKRLRPPWSIVEATIASGYEKDHVQAVDLESVWLQICRKVPSHLFLASSTSTMLILLFGGVGWFLKSTVQSWS